jgi:hypothetical protein
MLLLHKIHKILIDKQNCNMLTPRTITLHEIWREILIDNTVTECFLIIVIQHDTDRGKYNVFPQLCT